MGEVYRTTQQEKTGRFVEIERRKRHLFIELDKKVPEFIEQRYTGLSKEAARHQPNTTLQDGAI